MPDHSVLNFGQHIFARFISELVKISHMGQNIWGDYVAALCLSTEEVGCNGVIKAGEWGGEGGAYHPVRGEHYELQHSFVLLEFCSAPLNMVGLE